MKRDKDCSGHVAVFRVRCVILAENGEWRTADTGAIIEVVEKGDDVWVSLFDAETWDPLVPVVVANPKTRVLGNGTRPSGTT